jgi:hypothetical protein
MVSKPSGRRLDELERVCLLGGADDLLLRGVGLAVGDVLADGAVEEQRLLRHVGDLAAQALLGAVAHVLAIHQHAALLHVVQAQQQLGERGLARAGAPHQANALACGDVKVEVLEHVVVLGASGSGSPGARSRCALGHLQRLCVLASATRRGLVQHARHLGSVAKGAVDALHHGVEVVEAHREVVRVGEHHDQRAGADAKPRIAAHHKDRDHKHDHG